ncbi:hypothetical protein CD351_00490 [Erythrobacter sp. KY5]|nr:hypothetical protein CD351_00490 [Erythrobacter sp. KY5]
MLRIDGVSATLTTHIRGIGDHRYRGLHIPVSRNFYDWRHAIEGLPQCASAPWISIANLADALMPVRWSFLRIIYGFCRLDSRHSAYGSPPSPRGKAVAHPKAAV